jgi:ABC-type bacteriocin/lantibiotic exporter with double-glycine peptidase domain
MSNAPAIALESATVRLGGRTVLDSFSFSLAPGEKVTLTGRSGAGKSTVLRTILGFVEPASGRVLIEGEPLDAASVWRLRRRLAYVAQESDLGEGTVREVIERPFSYNANQHLRSRIDDAGALFDEFLLPKSILDEEMTTLSGGEKQRVAVIIAALLDRRIFLLDEPSSALDAASRDAVAAYFRTRGELTVLAVAHDADAFAVGGETLVVGRGGAE